MKLDDELNRIHTKLDTIETTLCDLRQVLSEKEVKQEGRLTKVEVKIGTIWKAVGGIGLVLMGAIVKLVMG